MDSNHANLLITGNYLSNLNILKKTWAKKYISVGHYID